MKIHLENNLQIKIFHTLFSICIFSILGLFIRPASAQAAVNFSLTPATGTYSDNFTVGFYANVNPAIDKVAGISIDINYSGPATYASYTDGASNCEVTSITPSTGSIHLECLATFPEGHITESGTVANLTFKPTGAGTVTIGLSVDEVGFVNETGSVGTVTGGTYTMTTGKSILPDTGFWDTPYLAGILFFIGGIFAVALSRKPSLLPYFRSYGSQSRVIIRKQ